MQLQRITSIAVALAGLWAASAAAQSTAPAVATTEAGGEGLSTVVVTATRRESNQQSTPIAVTGVDQRLLQDVAPNTISDIAAYVPNFSASKIQAFNATLRFLDEASTRSRRRGMRRGAMACHRRRYANAQTRKHTHAYVVPVRAWGTRHSLGAFLPLLRRTRARVGHTGTFCRLSV